MASFDISFEDDKPGIFLSEDDVMPVDVEELVVCRKELTDEMQKSGFNFTDQNKQKTVIFNFLISKWQISDSQLEVVKSDLLEKIRFFVVKAIKKYIESNQKYDRFVRNNDVFLSKNFDLPELRPTTKPTKSSTLINSLIQHQFTICLFSFI
jgi:hypothetical protein